MGKRRQRDTRGEGIRARGNRIDSPGGSITPARGPSGGVRTILPRGEAIGKVKAACAARTDPDFVIIARTDADEISFDEEVARCNLYLEGGADFAMRVLAKVNGREIREFSPQEQMEWHRRLC